METTNEIKNRIKFFLENGLLEGLQLKDGKFFILGDWTYLKEFTNYGRIVLLRKKFGGGNWESYKDYSSIFTPEEYVKWMNEQGYSNVQYVDKYNFDEYLKEYFEYLSNLNPKDKNVYISLLDNIRKMILDNGDETKFCYVVKDLVVIQRYTNEDRITKWYLDGYIYGFGVETKK